MAAVINRTTVELLRAVNTPDYDPAIWIINPDLSAVAGVPDKYWKIVGNAVLPMSAAEQAVVDSNAVINKTGFTGLMSLIFGDGSDGVVNISANTVLTQDLYATKLRVQAGFTLDTAGFRVIANTLIRVEGTLRCDGPAAVGNLAGASLNAGTCANGSAGATGTTGVGAAGTNLTNTANPGIGGQGGAGGAAGATAGGAGGNLKNYNNLRVRPLRFDTMLSGVEFDKGATGGTVVYNGGSGGGAGAGDGVNLGGGGGAGGGVLILAAPNIIVANGGVISANGGAGGGGVAGGGGGGGGGVILGLYGTLLNKGTISVTGGLGAAGVGTGLAGANGADGRQLLYQISS